jgi:dienelactone hydrolase
MVCLLAGLMLAVVSGGTRAADMDGTWHGKVESRLFLLAMQLQIDRDGSGWKGQALFSAHGKEYSYPLRNLKLSDHEISFTSAFPGSDLRVTGTLHKGKLRGVGEVIIPGRKSIAVEWEAVRAVQQGEEPRSAVTVKERVVDKRIVRELPRPTGPYVVGRLSLYWEDTSRPEVMTEDPQDHRELVVYLWYPAQPQVRDPFAPYVPDADPILKAKADDSLPRARSLRTNTVSNAPFAAGRGQKACPVLIFSHGLGVKSSYYTAILEELASHGYVVAAIEHPYDTSAVVFPDGRLVRFANDQWAKARSLDEETTSLSRERIEVCAADDLFVLNRLTKLNEGTPDGVLKGRLDLKRVGIFGHSMGGLAAARACAIDQRFKACVNMDGENGGQVYLPEEAGRVPQPPFLYLTKRQELTDRELTIIGTTRKQYQAMEPKRARREYDDLEQLPSPSAVALIRNTEHASFSDLPLFSTEMMPQPLEVRLQTAQIVRDLVRQFFDRYVRGDGSSRWPIKRPGVLIEQFRPSSRR